MIFFHSRHNHVIAGSHTACCGTLALDLYVSGCPVGHNRSGKSPLVSCCFRTGIVTVRSMYAVDQIVGCHDGHWLCILDCNLKSFQIDLTEGSLGQDRIRTHTVVFLVVACIMFDRCSASRYFLYTQCHGSSHHTGQQRIFGIIFKVSSAQRISVNVHTRCQPEGDTEQFHLVADHLTEFTNKVQIPGLCQKSSYRNRGTVLIIRSSSLLF